MSGNSKSFETENIKPLSHNRILILMAIVAVLSSVLGIVFESWRFGFGIALGGILSFINYYWLKSSLKSVFAKVADGRRPNFLAGKYILRYFALGSILAFFYFTKVVSIVAVLLGLSSFALAIVIEGLMRIFSSFSKQEEV